MAHKKGQIPWNKRLTKETDSRVAAYAAAQVGKVISPLAREKIRRNSNVAWSKGHTKETHEAVRRRGQTLRERCQSGEVITWNKGLHPPQLKGRTGMKNGWTPEMREKALPRIRAALSTPEVRKFRSEHSKWLWQQDWYREKVISAVVAASHKRPSAEESVVLKIIQENRFPFLYTGDGSYYLAGANPDFISYDETKVIEVWGEHWHSGRWFRETPEQRITRFETKGVSTLVLLGSYIMSSPECVLVTRLEKFTILGESGVEGDMSALNLSKEQVLSQPKAKALWSPQLSKEELEDMYIHQRLSIAVISQHIGKSIPTVGKWLRFYNIVTRSPSEFLKGRKVTWGDRIGKALRTKYKS